MFIRLLAFSTDSITVVVCGFIRVGFAIACQGVTDCGGLRSGHFYMIEISNTNTRMSMPLVF